MKMNLVVMFGGVSCEHDISIITAMQAIANIDFEKYNVVPIYITKHGEWLSGKDFLTIDHFKTRKTIHKINRVAILPSNSHLHIAKRKTIKQSIKIDCALLCFHGQNGEDGSIASIFELNSIPYTSAGVCGSSLCMDKALFKQFVKGMGLNYADFLVFDDVDFLNKGDVIEKVESVLGYPIIVKPSKLGSSIGISVANGKKELKEALELGFSLGQVVLVEKFLENIKEINCAILGGANELIVSELEEPIKNNKILSFENKYINSKNSGDMEFISRKMPPDISPEMYEKVVQTSKLLFKSLQLKGIIRIDYIVHENELLVNEINTIPGSFANYLFKPKNLSFKQLLDKTIKIAIADNVNKQQKIQTFSSDVLNNVNLNGVKKV